MATKREILSLVGLLQHASKVVRLGRTFTARMYSTAAKVKESNYFTRVNRDFRSDLQWWHTFINNWNGLSFLRFPNRHQPLIARCRLMPQAHGDGGPSTQLSGSNTVGQVNGQQ